MAHLWSQYNSHHLNLPPFIDNPLLTNEYCVENHNILLLEGGAYYDGVFINGAGVPYLINNPIFPQPVGVSDPTPNNIWLGAIRKKLGTEGAECISVFFLDPHL